MYIPQRDWSLVLIASLSRLYGGILKRKLSTYVLLSIAWLCQDKKHINPFCRIARPVDGKPHLNAADGYSTPQY